MDFQAKNLPGSSYFRLIQAPETYAQSEDDFHFHYNRNSGGGQAFLGGVFFDKEGRPQTASELKNKRAKLRIGFRDRFGFPASVDLDDPEAEYEIKPRGAGSNSMKFVIENRIRPSLVIDAALCLPPTTSVGRIAAPAASPLTSRNFWLQSMWLEVEGSETRTPMLVPRDLVFASSAALDGEDTPLRFWKVDFQTRIRDFLEFDPDSIERGTAREAVELFQAFYRGEANFEYQVFSKYRDNLMQYLASTYPAEYDGYSDPLPFMIGKYDDPAEEIDRQLSKPGIPKDIGESRNLIYFGAPGTGKSYRLNQLVEAHFAPEERRRITFHPDYTYSQFVGSFKPVSDPNDSGEIAYLYVFGPFLEAYVEAVSNPEKNFVLVIEEINRANPAAVFGELFQLLDRNSDGESEYGVSTSRELRTELEQNFNHLVAGAESHPRALELKLPPNLYLWCTMNSADQGVFPVDTAFRRRWDFRYVGLNEGSAEISSYAVPLGQTGWVNWNDLRKEINGVLRSAGVNDDRLLGPFFLKPSDLVSPDFTRIFKEKVLLYLYEDAAKLKRKAVFRSEVGTSYEALCESFDDLGEQVFQNIGTLQRQANISEFADLPNSDADGI